MGSSSYSTELLRAYAEENNQDIEEQGAALEQPTSEAPAIQILASNGTEDSQESNETAMEKAENQLPGTN